MKTTPPKPEGLPRFSVIEVAKHIYFLQATSGNQLEPAGSPNFITLKGGLRG